MNHTIDYSKLPKFSITLIFVHVLHELVSFYPLQAFLHILGWDNRVYLYDMANIFLEKIVIFKTGLYFRSN